jgi:short-subunit dehydrogenase
MSQSRVVFITGASSGVGYACALAFVQRGWNVIATARRADRLGALEAEVSSLHTAHGGITCHVCDVRYDLDVRNALEQGVAHFGRLDAVIVNAGVSHRGDLVGSSWDDVETLLRINIDGALHTIRESVPYLRESGGGQIYTISSVMFNMTMPYVSAYAASKAFMSSMAKSLRYELQADNITITDVRLGRTQTELQQKRSGSSGYSEGASSIPVMTAEFVADTLAAFAERPSHQRPQDVTLRWFDRMLVTIARFFPAYLAKRAVKQYKP